MFKCRNRKNMRLIPAVITLILATSLIFVTTAGASLPQDILGSNVFVDEKSVSLGEYEGSLPEAIGGDDVKKAKENISMGEYRGSSPAAMGGDDPEKAQYPGDVNIEAYGVNASMSGPTTMSLNSNGDWEGRVVYNAAILNIPLPFRYDFTSAFYYPILPYITMNGGNVNLSRSVSNNGVYFRSGNMYSWSPQKTKYATFRGKAVNRGWMNNYTRGTLGCCWSDTAWKYTEVN